ncbi:hypothetical protein [Mesorhizobium sp. B2-3-5]|uniref:hypothetical protein n=1 Tax=Mesorhizobium sp. B2-3-5 TaxID=2589958 RepID=UPI00112CDF75|nr:hypothetical protein [Mesorhizobium sp. B2-3-5]TPM16328.1 hypothetical protein FJ958_29210 [Mesorhizobium sp. B2-3-5]
MIRILAAAGIGLVAAALAFANVALYDTPVDISPTTASAQRNVRELQNVVAGEPTSVASTDFAETFERPLFTPTRRNFVPLPDQAPPPVQAATAPIAPPQPVAIIAPAAAPSLLGVSISSTSAKALLKIAGSNKANWYGSGETIDGWTVSRVEKDAATLERDGKSERIPLYQPPTRPPSLAGGGDGL